MATSEQLQVGVVQRLDAKAQPIGARPTEGAELLEICVAGVALEGDLGVVVHSKRAPGVREDGLDVSRRHERRRTTTEENTVDLVTHPVTVCRVLLELTDDTRHVRVDAVETRRLAVEVAVRTDR